MLQLGDPQAILHSSREMKLITDRKVSKETHLPIALIRVLINSRRCMADHLLKGYVQSTAILRILENWKGFSERSLVSLDDHLPGLRFVLQGTPEIDFSL